MDTVHDACIHDACIHNAYLWCLYPWFTYSCIRDACIHYACIRDACIMMYVSMMHLHMRHVRMMHICVMHTSMSPWPLILMHVCMMHISMILDPDHVGHIYDSLSLPLMQICIYPWCIFIYDPWSWSKCVWCRYEWCVYPWSLTLMYEFMMRGFFRTNQPTDEQGDSRSWKTNKKVILFFPPSLRFISISDSAWSWGDSYSGESESSYRL